VDDAATSSFQILYQATLQKIGNTASCTAKVEPISEPFSTRSAQSESCTSATITVVPSTQDASTGKTFLQQNSQDKPSTSDLRSEINMSRPYFIDYGGSVRNLLVAPSNAVDAFDSKVRRTLDERQVTVIASKQFQKNVLVCVGEGMILSDLIERVWMPSSETWQLSQRLMTRVDVDWQPLQID